MVVYYHRHRCRDHSGCTIGDPGLTDIQRRWGSAIEVTLRDGRVLTHKIIAAKGSFANPLTRLEEEVKALDLIVPVLGKRRSRILLDALWKFERIENVASLRKLVVCQDRANCCFAVPITDCKQASTGEKG